MLRYKKTRLILACTSVGLLLVAGLASIQPAIAGPGNESLFLQGNYLEVGISSQGWFGLPYDLTTNIPEGFHNTTENGLGFVADYQRDGWSTGNPPYGGDYLQAGSPYEGFAVEWTSGGIDHFYCQANDVCGPHFRNTSLVNTSSGETRSATWTGEVSAGNGQTLRVTHQMQFRQDDLFILIETTLANTGNSALDSLEFLRGIDPDNDQAWPGGDFDTINQVLHQPGLEGNPNEVLLRAAGTNHADMLLFLGTVDERARGSLDHEWLMDTDQVMDTPIRGPRLADDALALAWRFGTLEPGQEIHLTYFYGFGTDGEAEAVLDDIGKTPCAGSEVSILGGDLTVQNWTIRIPPAAVPDGSCLEVVGHDPASLPFDGTGVVRLDDPVEVKILPPNGPALLEIPFPYQICYSYQDRIAESGYQYNNLLLGRLLPGDPKWTFLESDNFPATNKVCTNSKSLGYFGLFVPLKFPSTGYPPGEGVAALHRAEKKGILGKSDLWLEIPRIQLTVPIVAVPLTETGWDVSWLDDEIGWLKGSAFPASPGNSILTGHVWNSTGLPGPFFLLNTLWYGDLVILHAGDLEYRHEVRSIIQVTAGEMDSLREPDGFNWLNLITCRGYDETNGTYRWRVLVQAVLTTVEQENDRAGKPEQ